MNDLLPTIKKQGNLNRFFEILADFSLKKSSEAETKEKIKEFSPEARSLILFFYIKRVKTRVW